MFIKYPHFCVKIISILLISISNHGFAEQFKGLVGEIEPATGRYTAADKSFQVTLPVKGTMDYILNTVTDRFTTRGSLVSIKPEKNASTYRLETSYVVDTQERNTGFLEASAKTIDWYRRLAARAYRGKLYELSTHPFDLDGKQAMAAIYKQFATENNGPRFHLFYLADFNKKLAFVWTDVPLTLEDLEYEEQIITGKAIEAKKSLAMLRSLRFDE